MEDDAMKGCLILLSLVFAGAVFAGIPASAKQAAAEDKAAAAKKETKWQGNVVRIYKDESQMDIRGTTPAGEMRTTAYAHSTTGDNSWHTAHNGQIHADCFAMSCFH